MDKTSGEKLKKLRHLIGVSQKELSVWLRCSPSSIPNYESGSSAIPFRYYQQFMGAGVHLDYFIVRDAVIEYAVVQHLYQLIKKSNDNV